MNAPREQIRGARWLRLLDPLARLDALLPERLNPFARSGAIATVTFVVACVTGALLLFWYTPSVGRAHASLAEMGPLAAAVRALHRYSSDACMLAVIAHTLRLFAAGRFAGARWLGWVTGVLLVGMLWVVGWSGYWLMWDARAHMVALGSARALDALPILTDPLARSFLTDEGVNSLLFFLIFFLHMLIPAGMGAAIWLHVGRISRPDWYLDRALTAIVVGALVAVSLLVPADLAAPAEMLRPPTGATVDAWYLLPLWLTARMSGAGLWALFLAVGLAMFSVPWALARRSAPPAVVDIGRCNACRKCFQDCPYEAIQMVPRTDGKGFDVQAQVDPARCVGCGICAGSCDTAGIGLPWLPVLQVRRGVDAWMAEGPETKVAFLCREALPDAIPDADGRLAGLPGWRVELVPCAGWVQALTVERAIRRGAREVAIGGCPGCRFREGLRWTEQRMAGERAPSPRGEKIEGAVLRVCAVRRLEDLIAPRRRQTALAAAIWLALLALTVAGSLVPMRFPASEGAELIVSFKHPGQVAEDCRPLTEAEIQAQPPHMRSPDGQLCERRRADVRLRVEVDGAAALERSYAPGGLWGDLPAVALETIALSPGRHVVSVAIDDGGGAYEDAGEVELGAGERAVVLFRRGEGFGWYW